MYLECTCQTISIDEWNRLMSGSRKASYNNLLKRIKNELPELYRELALNFPNPYSEQTRQTKTHYILVHSMIEYFIHK